MAERQVPMTMPLSKETTVTLSAAVAASMAFLGGAFWIHNSIQTLGGQMERMSEQVVTLRANQYTISQAAENALRMAIANPGMRVPDPRNPGQILVVER